MEDTFLSLRRLEDSGVFILTLHASKSSKGRHENKFRPELVEKINQALDIVETAPGSCALVVTGIDSFFSNGHDIEWLKQAVQAYGTEKGSPAMEFVEFFYTLLARFLTFPLITVAAVNGHAFAGGFLLAMAMDYRVMCARSGFMCMNEIDMAANQISKNHAFASKIKPGVFSGADDKMSAVLLAKLPIHCVREVLLEGRRYSGYDALHAKLIDAVTDGTRKDLLEKSISMAASHAHHGIPENRKTISIIKRSIHKNHLPIIQRSKI